MFGLFEPQLPVSLAEKHWIESRMCWMADTFGIARLRNATVVLPTPEFFPDTFRGRPEEVAPMFERLCGHMGVPAARFDLLVASEEILISNGKHCGGVYCPARDGGRERIEIAGSVLRFPEILLPVLAHELSHALLLGDGHVTGDEPDHEQLTDLFTVFIGMGVFMANEVVQDRTERMGNVSWNSIGKRGYLPARHFGYALALFAWQRDETCPRWARHLKGDGREALRLGLRYITKTGDSRFHPDEDGRTQSRSSRELISDLTGRRAATRFAALKDLAAQGELRPAEMAAVTESLQDVHAEVRALAAEIMGAQPSLPSDALQLLEELLADDDGTVRIAAAGALANVTELPDRVLDELLPLLDPDRQKSAAAAAAAVQRFGQKAARLAPRLLDCLARSLAQCNDANAAVFCECLQAICEDPGQAAESHFGEARLELLADVQRALKAAARRQRAVVAEEAP
jgi:hypothetical protein